MTEEEKRTIYSLWCEYRRRHYPESVCQELEQCGALGYTDEMYILWSNVMGNK